MKRLDFVRTRRFSSTAAALLAGLLLSVIAPTSALAASFDTTGPGFDGSTLGPADLVINPVTVPVFLDASDVLVADGAPVKFSGTGLPDDVCILIESGADPTTCSSGVNIGTTAKVSILLTLEIESSSIPGPFTLVMRDLDPILGYDESFVTVDGTHDAVQGGLIIPTGSNFQFDETNGVNGFDPFIVIRDDAGPADIRYYLGWTVNVGDTVTFRIDLNDGSILSSGIPRVVWSAIPVVVPEPGTALLMGLGLAGLAVSKRRQG